MNKHLILVKHSLPKIIENVPARQWHLSEDGQLRAEHLAKRLIVYKPEILVSSLEPKARETAEVIAQCHNLDVQLFEDLHEHNRSNGPYLSGEEFQNAVREFFLNPDMLVFGNETANEAHGRFSKAVDFILQAHKKKRIVIVSHGTVISLFVSRLTGISDYSLWNELGLPGFVVLDLISNTIITRENIS